MAILAKSPRPKKNRKSGKSAVEGTERQKSMVGCVASASRGMRPTNNPSGTPRIAAAAKPVSDRATVAKKSLHIEPLASPFHKLFSTAHGGGRNNGSISLVLVTNAHSTISPTGSHKPANRFIPAFPSRMPPAPGSAIQKTAPTQERSMPALARTALQYLRQPWPAAPKVLSRDRPGTLLRPRCEKRKLS